MQEDGADEANDQSSTAGNVTDVRVTNDDGHAVNPVKFRAIANYKEADTIRRLDCRYYSTICLSITLLKSWDGFSCRSCSGYTKITEQESRHDIECMAAMYAAKNRLAGP